ncbi:MAG: ATP-binding protein, partial [Omnitrophica WOR_2 bacterium]
TGGKTLQGTCYSEGSMPYGPFIQMLEDTLGSPNTQLSLPGAVLDSLIQIAPGLQRDYLLTTRSNTLDPVYDQQRVFDSILAWCSALSAQTPLLLFIDDIQWADSGTLSVLRHLARQAHKHRLLLLMNYREIELDEAGMLQNILHDLNRERLATRIKLTRLTKEQTHDLLEIMLNPAGTIDPRLVDAIFQETEGNPFFIEEVTKALIEEGKLCYVDLCWVPDNDQEIEIPQSVRVTIQSRLSRLQEQTQDILRLAAVIGREFNYNVLLKASEIDDDTLIDALENAEKAQIITEIPHSRTSPTTFSFAHALFPSTLRDNISTLRRQRLHRRVALAIESTYGEDDSQLEVLAYHYEQAGDVNQAKHYYEKAGDQALAVYANGEAERYYRSALELSDVDAERADLWVKLGEALFLQNRYEQATQFWQQAIPIYMKSGNYDQVARIYSRAARAAWYNNNPPYGLELCLDGKEAIENMMGIPSIEDIPLESDTPGIALLLHETARAYRLNDQPEKALTLCQQALVIANRLGLVDVQAETLTTLGIMQDLPKDEAKQLLIQAVEIAEANRLLTTAVRAHSNLGEILKSSGMLSEARKHFLRGRDLAQRIGNTDWENGQLASLADLSLDLGDFDFVENALPTLKQFANTLPGRLRGVYVRVLEARLLRRQGKRDQALVLLEECTRIAEQVDRGYANCVRVLLTDLQVELGKLEGVDTILADMIHLDVWSDQVDKLRAKLLLSQVYMLQGNKAGAVQLYEQVKEDPSVHNNRIMVSFLVWTEARLAKIEKNWDRAISAYEQLLIMYASMEARWYQGRALIEWAEVLIARGTVKDRIKAQQILNDAVEIFNQVNAPTYTSTAQQEISILAGAN